MLCERTNARNCSRSGSLITNAVLGLPILATSLITVADLMANVKLLMGHHTSHIVTLEIPTGLICAQEAPNNLAAAQLIKDRAITGK
jgi:hypothetical protein